MAGVDGLAKILLVEDDLELSERLQEWFKAQSDRMEVAHNGKDALQLLRSYQFDVVVLDWELPEMSGLEICLEYRRSGGQTPIIFLTGKSDIDSKQVGLDSGADDYLTKPFEPRELSARIKALLRRPQSLLSSELTFDGLALSVETRTIKVGAQTVHLMPKQAALLEFLMRNPNRAFSAANLLEAVWPSDSSTTEDSVRTCVKTLRRQLASVGKEDLVKTVLGTGYLIGDATRYGDS